MINKKLIDRLAIIFLILFIILSTTLSLYAAGYRFNWHFPLRLSQLLTKTGLLIVETDPNRVEIYLKRDTGGLFVSKEIIRSYQSPAKISNLLPGKYKVKLSKKGYWPINREIEIKANQTTHLTNLFLFKQTLPLNIYKQTKDNLIFNTNHDIVIDQENSQIIDVKSNEVIKIENYNSQINTYFINNNFLLNNNHIYDLRSGLLLIDLNNYFDDNNISYNKLYFDQRNKKIFYQTNNYIAYLHLNNQNKFTKNIIINISNYLDFEVKNNHLLVLEKDENQTYLRTYSLNSYQRLKSIILPTGDYQFFNSKHSLINLYDKKYNKLIIIDNHLLPSSHKIIYSPNNWHWINQSELIWNSQNEIYYYNQKTNQKKLLIRLSEVISGLTWQAKQNYLIFSTNNDIKIAYFIDNKIEIINLFSANNINSLYLNQKDNILYFYAELGQKFGIFKLSI